MGFFGAAHEKAHPAITGSLYNTPCNRFYNNYVIETCPSQSLWLI